MMREQFCTPSFLSLLKQNKKKSEGLFCAVAGTKVTKTASSPQGQKLPRIRLELNRSLKGANDLKSGILKAVTLHNLKALQT